MRIFITILEFFIRKLLNFWNILDNRNRSTLYKGPIIYKKYTYIYIAREIFRAIYTNIYLYKPLYFPRVENRGRKIPRNSHRSALDRVFSFSSSSYRLLSVILIVRECLHTRTREFGRYRDTMRVKKREWERERERASLEILPSRNAPVKGRVASPSENLSICRHGTHTYTNTYIMIRGLPSYANKEKSLFRIFRKF